MSRPRARPLFGRWRWLALGWLAVWTPAYALFWGWRNFFALCDMAVALTCVGIWRGSALILSTQALPSMVVGVVWGMDVTARLATGRHLIGGTEYMWDERVPLGVRLLSLFHIALPVVLVLTLRRTGYHRRPFVAQGALTLLLLVAARVFTHPSRNLNYAFADPFWGRAWGPAPVHMAVIFVGTLVLVYLPTHLALARWMPTRQSRTVPRLPR